MGGSILDTISAKSVKPELGKASTCGEAWVRLSGSSGGDPEGTGDGECVIRVAPPEKEGAGLHLHGGSH